MWKGLISLCLVCISSLPVMAAGNYIPKQFSNTTTGDGLYPYSLNNRRQQSTTVTKNNVHGIGGGTTPMQMTRKRTVAKRPTRARITRNAASQTNQTSSTGNTRRVVPRTNAARSATNNNTLRKNYSDGRVSDNRGTVARGASMVNNKRTTVARSTNTRQTSSTKTSNGGISSQKCFANYKDCMENYCLREDTAYNRCYCSAKLAQIDSKYQNKIDSLIQQIIKLQYNTDATDEEIQKYWDETVSGYTKTNPWVNIDKALNIDWPNTESRVRGQNAFNTGHQYCVNYLHSCAYMASNLRDAYKSEIARDCATYESTLQKIQTAAESVIENYNN